MWFINYIREVRAEFAHISWPTPRQAVVYTVVVIAISLIIAVYLGVLDFGFETLLKSVVNR